MSQVYKIGSGCFRYVVSFKLECSFEEAFERIEEQKEAIVKKNKKTGQREATGEYRKIWVRELVSLEGTERDLYNYIKNEYRFENSEDPLSDQKMGCEWLFWKSRSSVVRNGENIVEMLYFPKGISKKDVSIPKSFHVSITEAGINLYRNGLGFLWYEMALPLKEFDSEKLKQFQNSVRELNRGDKTVLWKKCSDVPKIGIANVQTREGIKKYITPFSVGAWIEELLSGIKYSFIAQRKANFPYMLCESMKNVSSLECKVIQNSDMNLYDYELAPDKAILFSYCALKKEAEDTQSEREEMIYHLANGYKNSYYFSPEIRREIKRPFDNVLWYATQEGAAYISWPENDNLEVFTSLIPSKMRVDYFTLYMKNLYQSFSLLLYAEKIQKEIPAVQIRQEREENNRISELFEEINLFLTKSMATSVSHIHHQSEFYIYLKKQLRIKEDVESITAGLNALDSLQREQRLRKENRRLAEEWKAEQKRDHDEMIERQKRENREKKSDAKIQAIMGLFALLGISSAFVDCSDFITKFASGGEWGGFSPAEKGLHIMFFVIIGVISLLAIIFAVIALKDAWKKDDNEQ